MGTKWCPYFLISFSFLVLLVVVILESAWKFLFWFLFMLQCGIKCSINCISYISIINCCFSLTFLSCSVFQYFSDNPQHLPITHSIIHLFQLVFFFVGKGTEGCGVCGFQVVMLRRTRLNGGYRKERPPHHVQFLKFNILKKIYDKKISIDMLNC